MQKIPDGFLVDSAWLQRQGVSRFLARAWVNSGWLKRIEHGLFQKAPTILEAHIHSERALLSAQHLMNYDFHVGSYHALRLFGFEHYLHLRAKPASWVYGEQLPNWLTRINLDAPVITRRRSLFSDSTLGITERRLPSTGSDLRMRVATPERAIFEALDEINGWVGFDLADKTIQSLTVLRPKLLAALLSDCKKIWVKRLFFVFADRYEYPWRTRLSPDDYDLGVGDRAITPGGKLHPTYRVVIPEEYVPGERPVDY